VDDSALAVVPAALWAVGSFLAYSAPVGLVALTANSTQVAYSLLADPSERHYSLGVQPAHLPAELRHDSPERYKAPPLASRVQQRGR
jgi:hypothetical protein